MNAEGALAGRRILVLRPEGQAEELAAMLAAEGAKPVAVAAVRIVPPANWGGLDAALAEAGGYDWIAFTSVNGVAATLERLHVLGLDTSVLPRRVAAVGPATRASLERQGVAVEWMPSRYTTAALAEELPEPPRRALLIRAEVAGPELEERLRARGFEVQRADAYGTVHAGAEKIRQALRDGVDVIALTSASIVHAFVTAVGGAPPAARIACIGPATAAACRANGIRVDVEASPHTVEGLVAAILGRLPGAR
ncbi:MAG: uroporphyrinogen-III synthase [Actinomycetota bacterium]